MTAKAEPKREIVRRNTKPRERPPADHPADVPDGATHFKLRKGGASSPACRASNAKGVQVEFHEIGAFDVATIARSWGYDSDYWVQFSRRHADGRRTNLGGPRRFGLSDPHELAPEGIEVEGGTVLPSPGRSEAPSLDSPAFALFQAFRSESAKEVAAGIEREQRRMDAQQSMVMSIVQTFAPRPSTGVDPVLAAILERMSEQTATTNALVARLLADRVEDPDDDDPDEPAALTDDEKVEQFKKLYREKGLAAFGTMMGEETAESLFRLIPKLRAKLPDVVAKLGPMLQAQLSTLLEGPPPPPAAAAAPRMVTTTAATAPAKPKPKPAAAPAPEFTVK